MYYINLCLDKTDKSEQMCRYVFLLTMYAYFVLYLVISFRHILFNYWRIIKVHLHESGYNPFPDKTRLNLNLIHMSKYHYISKYHRSIMGHVAYARLALVIRFLVVTCFMHSIFISRRKHTNRIFSLQYQDVFKPVHQISAEFKHCKSPDIC